ncbi:MAG: putative rane protein [Lachnospiraceae bacterium]|jgi:D-alanyl-D-alanine carboxypeptidase (penicillin-binding protein 5/6)|nr:putative rane protein [Lachnospiraceae bacterium]
MKKIVAVVGLICILGTGIILGTMAVQSVKNSFENYINKDKVGQSETSVNIEESKREVDTENDSESEETIVENNHVNNDKENNQTDDDNNAAIEREESQESQKSQDSEESKALMDNGILGSEEKENDSVEVISAAVSALNIINPAINIEATNAILMDCETGNVLYHKNAMMPIYPASTTKLMTALVALDLCDITEEITIGEEVGFIASDSSRAYLKEGQRLTMQMLLEGAIVPSGNDAAYVIAAYCGRKILDNRDADAKTAIRAFVNQMNEKAKELGLISSQFMNPDGYDEEGQYTTAYDMGIIAMEAIKSLTIRTISGKSSARNIFLSGEDVTWKTSNKLINTGSGMYYQYAIGLKTGTSSHAGRCLVSAAEKDGKKYISVVMNSTSAGRWEDSIDLLSYGIEH